jgi:hypothetical protein
MHIEPEALDEFIDIWEREFGERLSCDEASNQANRLLTIYRAIAEEFPDGIPMPASSAPDAAACEVP